MLPRSNSIFAAQELFRCHPSVYYKSCQQVTDNGINASGVESRARCPIAEKAWYWSGRTEKLQTISNLKFLFKTIERIASSQLNVYLQENGLFAPMQSAYRKYHSTETALLRLQNDLLRAVDQHQDALLICSISRQHLTRLIMTSSTLRHYSNCLEMVLRVFTG